MFDSLLYDSAKCAPQCEFESFATMATYRSFYLTSPKLLTALTMQGFFINSIIGASPQPVNWFKSY